MSLSGKVCLVTGSSKGIGRGIALQLGGHGATVYVTGRSKDKLESCVEEINKRVVWILNCAGMRKFTLTLTTKLFLGPRAKRSSVEVNNSWP